MEFSTNTYYKCNNPRCIHNDLHLLGSTITENDRKCPECPSSDFSPIEAAATRGLTEDQKSYIKLGAVILGVLIVIGGILFFTMRDKEVTTPDTIPVSIPVPTSISIPVPIPVPAPDPEPFPAPQPYKVVLSYGIYNGETLNGKPHGQGTITYNKRTLISKYDVKRRYATKGQYVVGSFENGHLIVGKLFNADNKNIEILNIGKR